MKNKIFEAIQKGVSNILVINDKDLPINYHKKETENNINPLKIKSLTKLLEIFKDDKFSIFGYDTNGCLTLIIDDGTEISLHEYTLGKHPVFLKIQAECFKKSNALLIALDNNHYISKSQMKWSEKTDTLHPMSAKETIPDAICSKDGYSDTLSTLKIGSQLNISVPAVKYCNDLNIQIGQTLYQGYLPSAGQLDFISKYLEMLNYIFNEIGSTDIDNLVEGTDNDGGLWASTESNLGDAWKLIQFLKINYYVLEYVQKTTDAYAMPFFKQIN